MESGHRDLAKRFLSYTPLSIRVSAQSVVINVFCATFCTTFSEWVITSFIKVFTLEIGGSLIKANGAWFGLAGALALCIIIMHITIIKRHELT